MKRFLSIFAIMAMIVSMFSGVAFADATTSDNVELEVIDDTIYYGDNVVRNLRGNAFDGDDARISGDVDAGIRLYGSGTPYKDEFTISDGEFTRQLIVGESNYEVGNYILEVTNPSDYTTTTSAAFTVVNEVELETPTDLDFYLSDLDDELLIQGIYVNGDGPTSAGSITLAYRDDDNLPFGDEVTANYSTEDDFGFLFDAEDEFTDTGDIGLFIDGVLAVKGKIMADDLDVSMSPTVFEKLDAPEQNVELSFANAVESDQEVDVTIKDNSSTYTYTTANDDDTQYAYFNEDNDVLTIDLNNNSYFDVSDLDEDDYVLVVELINSDGVTIEKAELDFEVDEPDDYNLVNWTSDEVTVGSHTFEIGSSLSADSDYLIHVVDDDNDTIDLDYTTDDAVIEYEITYSGAGIAETTYNTADEGTDADTFSITPTETGMIDMDIVVKDDGTTLETFNKEIEVTGWNVTVSPTEVVVGEENDFLVEIVDEDGITINNAKVTIDGTTVDSATKNITDGQYLFEDLKFDDVGNYDVVTELGTTSKVTLEDEIEVVGEEVYAVDSDMTQLLTGIEDTVAITVLDEDGDIVYPSFYQIDYDKDGDAINTTPALLSGGTRVDLDGDGSKEAVEFDITPDNDAVETVIRATTDDDTKMGEVAMEVLKPELVHTGAEVITENFETELEFTVVDPRDDSVMELDLEDLGAASVDYSDVDPVEEALDDNSDDVWTATVLVQEVDWTTADEDEATVELTVKTTDDLEVGTIEVVKPTLTSDPEEVIMGTTNNIVLTYLDGEGNPLEDYAVMLDGEEIGDTNADGQVTYATSTVSTSSLEFEAATDAEEDSDTPIYTELTVKSGVDNTVPVITAEVEGDTGLITITDNAKLAKVAINGEELDVFYLGDSVTEMVELAPGVNTFDVEALDANGNYAQEILELEAEEEPFDGIQFTLDEESEYGTPTLLGNTTMIPVRFAENLGATVSWDAPTATVTYEVNDTVIELTVGSTTAVVNGENVQLSQAPYINELGRTMVPVRMVGEELGFTVHFTSMSEPITIK